MPLCTSKQWTSVPFLVVTCLKPDKWTKQRVHFFDADASKKWYTFLYFTNWCSSTVLTHSILENLLDCSLLVQLFFFPGQILVYRLKGGVMNRSWQELKCAVARPQSIKIYMSPLWTIILWNRHLQSVLITVAGGNKQNRNKMHGSKIITEWKRIVKLSSKVKYQGILKTWEY